MFSLAAFISLALLGALSEVAALGPHSAQIKNLVTFGDSYTDVVRTKNHILVYETPHRGNWS